MRPFWQVVSRIDGGGTPKDARKRACYEEGSRQAEGHVRVVARFESWQKVLADTGQRLVAVDSVVEPLVPRWRR